MLFRSLYQSRLVYRSLSIEVMDKNKKLFEFITNIITPLTSGAEKNPNKFPITMTQMIRLMTLEGISEIPKTMYPPLIKLCENTIKVIPELSPTDLIRITQSLHQISSQIGFRLNIMHFENYLDVFKTSIPGISIIIG